MQRILFLYMQIIITPCDSSILYLIITMRMAHIQIYIRQRKLAKSFCFISLDI